MPNGITSNGLGLRSDPAVELARVPVKAAEATPPAPAAPVSSAGQDLRLNIDHDQASGSFVYKFVNPTTGQVIQQIPSEELLKLRAAAEYSAGRVINTKA